MKFGILWDPRSFSIDSPCFSSSEVGVLTGENIGNMAYVEGLRSLFDGCEYEFIPWWYNHTKISDDIECLVFPAANQLGNHVDLSELTKNFLAYKRPVIAFGLGAQFNSPDDKIELNSTVREWLDVLVSLAPTKGTPNIVVRGDFTASVLDRLGYRGCFVSAGCPSQFINLSKDLYFTLKESMKSSEMSLMSYNTSHYAWAWAKEVDRAALAYCMKNSGQLVVQAPMEYIELVMKKSEMSLAKDFSRIGQFLSVSDPNELSKMIRSSFVTFSSVVAWRSWACRFDFNFGTRIHGSMVALQTGVPSFLVTHDTRTEELSRKIGVPYCHYSELPTQEEIIDYVKDRMINYDYSILDKKRKENALLYLKFINSNSLPVSSRFSDFVGIKV